MDNMDKPCEFWTSTEHVTRITTNHPGWDSDREVTLARVHIGCVTHDTRAIGTFRSVQHAYETFQCDKGQGLRFLINYDDEDFEPILCDLGDMTTNVKNNIEDFSYGQDVPRFHIFLLKTDGYNPYGASGPYLEKLHIVRKSQHTDDRDYIHGEYDIRDNSDNTVASFMTSIDGRA